MDHLFKKTTKNKIRYMYYFLREIIEQKIINDRLKIKRNGSLYFGKRQVPGVEETNRIIYDEIIGGKPFAMVRPGNGELSFALEWEEEGLFGRRLYKRRGNNWQIHKDIFKNRSDEYNELFRKDISETDVLVVFPESIREQYLVERYCPDTKVVSIFNIGPYNAQIPWTDALKGKKVLVVSQFADFLQEQYEKRDRLFNGEWQWPEFELIPVRSVWYFAKKEDDDQESWFDKLNYLYEEIMKHEFDIAILACGSFAINLAPMIKRAGKQAIQYGGELQMMFGIRGARWDDSPFFKKYYNDSWIRVSKEQVGISMQNANSLDDGCYW